MPVHASRGNQHPLPRALHFEAALGMNRKYIVAAIAAGAALAGCGWYLFKVSQREAEEMQQQLHSALQLAQESKYDECTSLLQDTIEKMKLFYGPEHPTTIHTVAILAEILHRQNKLPEAEALMRACCIGLDKALGCDHEESLGCRTELMHILGDAGKSSEALATGRQLFDTLCHKFGPSDLQCVRVGCALCAFMKAEGDLQSSVDFARILVESCRSGSPSSASSPEPLRVALHLLTELLRDSGSIDEAICCARELVAVCTANNLETDGPPQSHYLLLNLQLAVSIDDALLTARSATNFCEQQHGAQSHEHVESQLVLARLLSQSGAFQEALTTWERVFVVLAQSLGPEHHEILDMQVQMATCLLQLERHAEAEVMLQRVVAMHESLPDGKLSATYLLAAHYLSLIMWSKLNSSIMLQHAFSEYTLLKGLELSKAAAHGLTKVLGDKHDKSREAKEVYRGFLSKKQVLLPASPSADQGSRPSASAAVAMGSPASSAPAVD